MGNRLRRFLCACLAMALLGAGLPICAGRAEASDTDVEAILSAMSLRDKIAQMLIISPRSWQAGSSKAKSVRSLNDALRDAIAKNRYGGVLFFVDNCGSAEQMLKLTSEIQTASLSGGGVPMLISVDQEGGIITRLSAGTDGIGNMALAATGDPENARAMARVHGEELSLVGINTDFAPSLDINNNPTNPVIGVRSFGDSPEVVSEFGCAFVQGLQDTNTIATLKHFPGHGNTGTDSHSGLPTIDVSLEALTNTELVPFKAAIEAGADMVMTAHIRYPQIETGTYTTASGRKISLPATMSKTILTDILRGRLGFEGVIVSDSLEMAAISDNFSQDDMLTLCINAGVNMLLLSHISGPKTLKAMETLLDRAVALTEQGKIDVARVEDSVRRILTLKKKRGLLGRTDFTVTEEALSAARAGVGSKEHLRVAWDLASRALTLLKNENGAFPLKVRSGERTLILFTVASRGATGDLVKRLLGSSAPNLESMVIDKDTAKACVSAAKKADHVIIVSRVWNMASLNPNTDDGYPITVVNKIIDNLHGRGKTAIVISAQLPYDAVLYPRADAILLAYCSSSMRNLPAASGPGSAYVPNLPVAICAALGLITPQGRLPVNIPALDENHRPTGAIVYPRQL